LNRPILIQNTNEVIEVVKEMTGIIIDTGIFDRPIYIQESSNNVVVEETRDIKVEEEPVDYELRGDTSLWWLYYKKDNTNVIEIKKDIVQPTESSLNVNHRLPLGYKSKLWVPNSSKVLNVNQRLPLGFKSKPWVSNSSKVLNVNQRLPLGYKSKPWVPNSSVVMNVNHKLPIGYDVAWTPKFVEVSREVKVESKPVSYLNVNHELPLGYQAKPWSPRSSCIIKPLIKLPLAVDYLFQAKNETREVSPAKVENVSSNEEVDRLKLIIKDLSAKLDQKVQSLAELNGRVANLSLMLNEANQKNRDLTKQYEVKLNDMLNKNVQLNGNLARVTLDFDDSVKSLKDKNTTVPSMERMADINQKLAVLTLDYDSMVREKNSELKNMNQHVENLRQKVSGLNTQLAVVSLNTNEEVKQAKKYASDNTEKVNKLSKTAANLNTNVAVLSLAYNDEVRGLKHLLKEKDVKIEKLQKSNAQINGQLATLTLNVDETVNELKNANVETVSRNVEPVVEVIPRNVVEVPKQTPVIASDNNDVLKAKMAQINTQLAKLTLDSNEEVRSLLNDNKEKTMEIEKLRGKLGQMNTQVAVLSLHANDVEKAKAQMEKNNREVIDELRSKLAETNGNLAKVSVDTKDEINAMKNMAKDYSTTIEDLRTKYAKVNSNLAVNTLNSNEAINNLKKIVKEDEKTIDALRTKAAEINTNLAIVSLNTPSSVVEEVQQTREVVLPEVSYISKPIAPDMEDSLRTKAAEINTRLAMVTLKYDEDVRALKAAQKQKDILIEELREKAAVINSNLATLTLDSNEECACLKEIAVEKQLEVETLRSNASQLNGQLANLTLNLDEVLRSNNAYLKDKAQEVEFLRQCTVQLNQQLARLTLSFDDIIKKNNGYMAKQQETINNLTEKAADLNGRLARLTLNYDEMNHANNKKVRDQEQIIEKLQQKAAELNSSIAKLTLAFDEMAQQKATEGPVVESKEIAYQPVENVSGDSTKFRDMAVKLNHNLSTLTLQYDEDMAKKNKTIKNLKDNLNATNVAFNNARRGSVVAKIQKIERLTDISTNLNSNLAKVSLEFNEMVQSKNAEINKLKNTLNKYENLNQRRESVITVEYNNANYYNISQNDNPEKKVNKEMGSPAPQAPVVKVENEVPAVAPAAEPEIEVIEKEVVEELPGKKKSKKGKKSSKKSKAVVKKSKYSDLTIEQKKAMNKELVNQSCNIL